MNIPHEKFCVLPWVSLETSPIGTVRPCCLATGAVSDEDGNEYSINETSIHLMHESEYMNNLRQQFLDGEQPELCRRCWAVEDAGGTSKRMHTLNRLKHILEHETFETNDPKPLMFLDLKLGNICNISCRICGSWSSSTYATEEIKHLDHKEKKKTFAYTMLREGAWPRKTQEFWADLEDLSQGIRYLEFTGGEPFMIKEHFAYLEFLVTAGFAENIEIHYNTNGTIFPEEYIHLWNKFKHVEIAFSIDDVGKRFEYQRDGAKWSQVLDNLGEFIYLKKNTDNISLQICTTVNVFNIFYLEQVAQWIESIAEDIDFVYWNMLHDAPVHCITSLPRYIKIFVEHNLKEANVSAETKQEFLNIIEFMMGPQTVTTEELQDNILTLDERKGQSMRYVMPKFYNMLFML